MPAVRLVGIEYRRPPPVAPALRRALANAARGLDSVQVVISADAQTPHQSVVTVMDAARRAGLYRLTFATRRTEEPVR